MDEHRAAPVAQRQRDNDRDEHDEEVRRLAALLAAAHALHGLAAAARQAGAGARSNDATHRVLGLQNAAPTAW